MTDWFGSLSLELEKAPCPKLLIILQDGQEEHEVAADKGAYDPGEQGVQLFVAAVAFDAVPI